MSLYCAIGSPETDLSPITLEGLLTETLTKLGPRKRVLAVPPDQTRAHSRAGELTRYAWGFYKDKLKAVLPALGTHAAMNQKQFEQMYGGMLEIERSSASSSANTGALSPAVSRSAVRHVHDCPCREHE